MSWRRLSEGVFLICVLAAIVVAALAFAHSWSLPNPSEAQATARCFSTILTSQFPKWVGCTMAAHENLAGGLLGASGALFAAWLAWTAVSREIKSQTWYEDESFQTVVDEITPLVDLLDKGAGAIALALDNKCRHQDSRVTAIRTMLAWSLPSDDYFKKLDGLAEELAPAARNRFQKLIERLRLYVDQLTEFRQERQRADEEKWRIHDLRLANIQLALVKRALDRFAPNLGQKLRTPKVSLGDDTWADQLDQQLSAWLAEEQRRDAMGPE